MNMQAWRTWQIANAFLTMASIGHPCSSGNTSRNKISTSCWKQKGCPKHHNSTSALPREGERKSPRLVICQIINLTGCF